jgi:hypothetical protein
MMPHRSKDFEEIFRVQRKGPKVILYTVPGISRYFSGSGSRKRRFVTLFRNRFSPVLTALSRIAGINVPLPMVKKADRLEVLGTGNHTGNAGRCQ